ncbi:DNA cytosine methyltransferase [Cellulosimicrobium sp. NPDC057862]|uniref:DNA cytosine methyltransferase n=1 Tax=Actinomycetes TaxID=1760 RepID=UPI0036733212
MVSTLDGFTFVDLFAGIGGFHAALADLGGRCVYACETDPRARKVYEKAWIEPDRSRGHSYPFAEDINDDVAYVEEDALPAAQDDLKEFPEHDVLAAGFPCQAFSKSGKQHGVLDETRGTLFYNILRIVRAKRPRVVFLENVKNLAGPKHRDTTFKTIIRALHELGYVVAAHPTVISPHRISPRLGGTPQMRERIYIMAIHGSALGDDLQTGAERIEWTRKSRASLATAPPFAAFEYDGWDPGQWRIRSTPLALYGGEPILVGDARLGDVSRYAVGEEGPAIAAWDGFVREVVRRRTLRRDDGRRRLPGHPIWLGVLDEGWLAQERADAEGRRPTHDPDDRGWKHAFLDLNERFVVDYRHEINATLGDTVLSFERSRQKFEWQAQDASSLDECLIQLRPSGIRVKKATYTPALVAINQTPILGKERRRIAPLEAARLQGFPDRVAQIMTKSQPDSASYKQLGNAVHVGAVAFALAQFLGHFEEIAGLDPRLQGARHAWRDRWEAGDEAHGVVSRKGLPVGGATDDDEPRAA